VAGNSGDQAYGADQIQVLEGLDPVRKRPGMYIGGTGSHGYHHLLWELVDNAVDEAMNGHATSIGVSLDADLAGATVTDNGRGIPFDTHKGTGRSALDVIFTTLHAGGKFDSNGAYHTSGGLHGVGASVVNALSGQLTVWAKRDGTEARMSFARGKAVRKLKKSKGARGAGTTVHFRPDEDIFGQQRFDPDLVAERLDIKAYLNRGLRIVFDAGNGKRHTFQHDGGVADFGAHLVSELGAQATHAKAFVLNHAGEATRIEMSLQWTDSTHTEVRSFVNTIPTRDGGTHLLGLMGGVTKAVRNYMETHNLVPRSLKLSADDIREGLTGVISVFVREPQFQGQTKDRLNNPELRTEVEGLIRPQLEQWLHDNGSIGEAVAQRAIQAAKAREASRAAATQVRRKSPVNKRLNLPGKLADCSSSSPDECELFLVEGDSAGGSAKQGRDRRIQAILPLRGKVLNAENAGAAKVSKNAELSDIVKALGCGMGDTIRLQDLRYGKVIVLADADSDGNHIATLLLTFFYRYMRPLIDDGRVFVAQPPLYRVDHGKATYWATDDEARARIVTGLPKGARPEITRFKGLGEMMPKVLFATTLDPKRRRLLRVTIPDDEEEQVDRTIRDLMGKEVAPRFRLVTEGAAAAEIDV
jgi:DNA gyrase subunit B/topoisomerase-4 subunit B